MHILLSCGFDFEYDVFFLFPMLKKHRNVVKGNVRHQSDNGFCNLCEVYHLYCLLSIYNSHTPEVNEREQQ